MQHSISPINWIFHGTTQGLWTCVMLRMKKHWTVVKLSQIFSRSENSASPVVLLTWAIIRCQVAAVTGRVGEVRNHHTDASRGTEASTTWWGLTALWPKGRARTSVRWLPQLPSQEEGPHLAPPDLAPLVILVILFPSTVARKPLSHTAQWSITTWKDGRWGVLVVGFPLHPHALFQLAEGGGAFVLHDKIKHAGGQVVSGELDGDLNVSSFFLFLSRLRLESVPPVTQNEPFTLAWQSPRLYCSLQFSSSVISFLSLI